MIKRKVKSLIPLKTKLLLSYIKNINHNPYTLKSLENQISSISDFFVFDRDCHKMCFVAENVRSLLIGEKVDVEHNFIFFSSEGKILEEKTFRSNDFFTKIFFDQIKNCDKYSSFTHFVESEYKLKDFLIKNKTKNDLKLYEQNRGYSIYYPSKNSLGSAVHGNFGGISKGLIQTAKKTILSHIYTPIYKFNQHSKFHLVFNNPTSNQIFIKIIFNDSLKTQMIKIPSMGTNFLEVEKYTGSLSFESRLPICRALVFKNPSPNFSGTFDVFHS